MDLIESIRNEILDNENRTSSILRKARVLASLLNNKKLEAWSLLELNGYKTDDKLPNYRSVRLISQGNLSGGFGSSATNITLPISNFPPKIQDWANKTEMREGIGALETWVKSGDKLIIPWPTEFVAEVQSRVIESMNLISAWKIIPLATITQIIDSITNNLLEFIIDIRKKYPNIKDENEYHNIKRKDVDSSFNNYISSSNFIEE